MGFVVWVGLSTCTIFTIKDLVIPFPELVATRVIELACLVRAMLRRGLSAAIDFAWLTPDLRLR